VPLSPSELSAFTLITARCYEHCAGIFNGSKVTEIAKGFCCYADVQRFPFCVFMCRIILKSLHYFRPLRYSSRDGYDGAEHVNRGTDTPSFCSSVWYTVRNLRCTVTIDSILANCKTQNAFLSPVHAMFRHDCPLAVKPASTPQRLLPPKKL
jgi:hypothetical protein